MNQPSLPLTKDDLTRIPRARATCVTYPWMGKTYSVWIGEAPFFGWSILSDDGRPGQENVITSPHNREDCISALVSFMDYAGAVATDWTQVTPYHDAWIGHVRSGKNVHWSPLPAEYRGRS